MISSLAIKCQHFKLRGLLQKGISTLKSWHFEASEDIITKFKSQGLYTIKIKYWNASGSSFPPSLIPALQYIGMLHYKKAKLRKHMNQSLIHFFFQRISLMNFVFCWKSAWIHHYLNSLERAISQHSTLDTDCLKKSSKYRGISLMER